MKTQTTPTLAAVAPATTLRINYGINRRTEKGGIEHRCGKLTIAGTWGDDETHKSIRAKIFDLNPGWMVTGYCLPSPQNASDQLPPSGGVDPAKDADGG